MIDQLKKDVADAFGVRVSDIDSHRRSQRYTRPRQVVMYIARGLGMPLAQIGKAVGRDHTTILSGCRRIENALGYDEGLRASIDTLTQTRRVWNSGAMFYRHGHFDEVAVCS